MSVGQSLTRKDRPSGRPRPSSTFTWRNSGCLFSSKTMSRAVPRQMGHHDAGLEFNNDRPRHPIDLVSGRLAAGVCRGLGHDWTRFPGSIDCRSLPTDRHDCASLVPGSIPLSGIGLSWTCRILKFGPSRAGPGRRPGTGSRAGSVTGKGASDAAEALFTGAALGLKLHEASALAALACMGALWITVWRARREKLNTDSVYELAVWLMSGGFIGARALYLVSHPGAVRIWTDVFKVWQGGIVFYGCIIGGLIGSVTYWRRHPFPFLAMADAVAPALAVGCLIGRLGCFLNGCCYGGVSNLPWAVQFPAGSLPWGRQVMAGLIPESAAHSLPVHPAQLYAAFDGLFVLGLLTWYFPKRKRDGEVMACSTSCCTL